MAALKYRDEHNRIGFLEKPKGSTDYHQVIDFLLDSHIRYALVTDPLIYDSLITQFWSTASLRSSELGPPAIVATIDETLYTITESLMRSQLQLHDEGGIVDMPIPDIFLGMDNLGYPTEGKLTFHKNKFSPQWRERSTIGLAISLLGWCCNASSSLKLAIAAGTSESVPPNTQLFKPTRPIPTSPSAQVNQQGPSTDPHVESSSKDNNMIPWEDLSLLLLLGPLQLHLKYKPWEVSRGTLNNLTALYTLVSEQGKKIEGLESELQAHKLLFKDVMGKLVKRVNYGSSYFCWTTSSVPADVTQATGFPPSSSIHNDVPTGAASDFSA
ncbi:hypothetical protein Tco_0335395 [Tanacetum coccineum]